MTGASALYIIGLLAMPFANPATDPASPLWIVSIATAGTAFIGLAFFTRYLLEDPWMDRTMVRFVAGEILFIAILTLVAAFVLPATFLSGFLPSGMVAVVILPFVAMLQAVIALAASPALFGTWRPGIYREKLQWDAFRRFLSDFTSLERAGKDDMDIWGEWLVYGTALGVGEKVVTSMRHLSVSSQETDRLVALMKGTSRKKEARKS
jgi:uncharacterized membrane protein